MLSRWRQALATAIASIVLGATATYAQTGRMWIDPPGDRTAPQAKDPGVTPEPNAFDRPEQGSRRKSATGAEASVPLGRAPKPAAQTSPPSQRPSLDAAMRQPPPIARLASQEDSARNLVVSYLDTWSADNQRAVQATPAFYSSTVMFHGRQVSLQSLLNEKRRFMERWPERHYRYRPETMTVMCQPGNTACHVRAVYDYDASNLARGRHSRGTGVHDLVVSFAGDRAVIISESSRVLGGPDTVTR